MKTAKHMFEDGIYLISNHSVAKNPLFASKSLQDFFLQKIEKHLAPISNVMAYNLNDNGFELLVKLKNRTVFEDHLCPK